MARTIRKALSLLLCAALLFALAPVTAVHAEGTSGTCGADLVWVYNTETNTLTISGTGKMDDYSFNNSNGLVTNNAPWRVYYSMMKSVVINSGVTSIGDSAFAGFTVLKSVTMPDSITSIGRSSFYKCKSLPSVNISKGVKTIHYSAFKECSGLTSLILPTGVTSIGERAFCDCEGLTSFVIPDSVTSLGQFAFYSCDGLTDVTIGSGLTSLSYSAFGVCGRLTNVTFSDNLKSIDERAFYACHALTGIWIPEGVTTIEKYAFEKCENLTSVMIPDSVMSMGYKAFDGCSDDLVIYSGYRTCAQQFAEEYNITFVLGIATTVVVSDLTMNWKSKAALDPTVTTPKGMGYTVAYSSSDPSVVSIDENGEMTGLKKGKATVTVTVTNAVNRTGTDSCTVTVKYTVLQWIIVYLLFGWIWYK